MRAVIPLTALFLVASCAPLPPSEIPRAPSSQSRAVVFDVDGTLTPAVLAITEVRPDAAKAARMYSEKGYQIVYLSVRISILGAGLPEWLKKNGFPDGIINVSQTDAEQSNPAAFKARILKDYVAQGWKLVGAYGDSSTDFQAYAEAGIPKNRVFALLRRGEATCQNGEWQECLRGWTEHLTFIANSND